MAESDANNIKEGFLCPVCHKDLRTPTNLLTHFQDQHSEEQDLLKSIKDLVGKAKKKILKVDEQDLESFKTEISLQKYYLEYSEPQEPGLSTCHTEYFKSVRRERLDHRTAETNRLIIRLDKLLRVEGSDRKHKEQELVTWLDGTTVTRCPSCAASFNITRRQHHCRLCGSIICHSNCSRFLSYDTAKLIVTPVYTELTTSNPTSTKSNVESLRICTHCMNMLENRRSIQMSQVIQPPIYQLYWHLQKVKTELQPSVDLYEKMYNSLTSGDTKFQLQDAQSLRSSIAKQAEMLDAISKKILSLPPDPEHPRAVVLQTAIRRATSQYIKEYLLVLPVLPSPAELDRIKKQRAMRNVDIPPYPIAASVKKVAVTTGWSPETVAEDVPEISDDPLIQQINIVRNYIDQARKAHRFEEVAALQENLTELKQIYQAQLRTVSKNS